MAVPATCDIRTLLWPGIYAWVECELGRRKLGEPREVVLRLAQEVADLFDYEDAPDPQIDEIGQAVIERHLVAD
jgi:hypothetical protein